MGTVRWTVDEQHNVKEIHKVVVHEFDIQDITDDPVLYAGPKLHEWEHSESGQYVMKHAEDKPTWFKDHNWSNMSYKFVIVAELEMKKLSEFYLRWGKDGNP